MKNPLMETQVKAFLNAQLSTDNRLLQSGKPFLAVVGAKYPQKCEHSVFHHPDLKKKHHKGSFAYNKPFWSFTFVTAVSALECPPPSAKRVLPLQKPQCTYLLAGFLEYVIIMEKLS